MELELVSVGIPEHKPEFVILTIAGTLFEDLAYLWHGREWSYLFEEIGRIPFHQEDAHTLGLKVNYIL